MVDWIHIEKTTGPSGTTIVSVSADENYTTSVRQTTLTVKSGNKTETIYINQLGIEKNYITATPNTFYLPYEGGEFEIVIDASGPWSLRYTDKDWYEIVPGSGGSGNTTVKLIVQRNDGDAERKDEGYKFWLNDSNEAARIEMTQLGKPSATMCGYDWDWLEQYAECYISVKNIPEWDVKSNCEWLKVEKLTGTKNGYVKVTADANIGPDRECRYCVYSKTIPTIEICKSVKQTGWIDLGCNKIDYTANERCGDYKWYDYFPIRYQHFENGVGAYYFSDCPTEIYNGFLNGNQYNPYNNIKTIKLPSSITRIGNEFARYQIIETIDISNLDKLTYIGTYFLANNNIREMILPESLKTATNYFLEYNNSETVDLSKTSFVTFGDNVLQYSNVKNLILPETLETIGDYFIGSNREIERIEFPASLKSFASQFGLGDSSGNVNLRYIRNNAIVEPVLIMKSWRPSPYFNGLPYYGVLSYPKGSDYSNWCNATPDGWKCVEYDMDNLMIWTEYNTIDSYTGSRKFYVYSEKDWSLSTSCDWLTVDTTSGEYGVYELEFNYDANEESYERACDIILSNGNREERITIRQRKHNEYVNCNEVIYKVHDGSKFLKWNEVAIDDGYWLATAPYCLINIYNDFLRAPNPYAWQQDMLEGKIHIPDTVETLGTMAFACNTNYEFNVDISNTLIKEIGQGFLMQALVKRLVLPDTLKEIKGTNFLYESYLINEIVCYGKEQPIIQDISFGRQTNGVLFYPKGSDYSDFCEKLNNTGTWNCMEFDVDDANRLSLSKNELNIISQGEQFIDVYSPGTIEWRAETTNDWIHIDTDNHIGSKLNFSIQVDDTTEDRNGTVTFTNGYDSVVLTINQESSFVIPLDEIWFKVYDDKDFNFERTGAVYGVNGEKANRLSTEVNEFGWNVAKFDRELYEIGNYFSNYDNITPSYISDIILPDNITKIGDYFINGGSKYGVKNVILPKNLVEIGLRFLYQNEVDVKIKFNDKLETVGNEFLSECKAITSLDLSMTKLNKLTGLTNVESLVELKLPKTLRVIDSSSGFLYKSKIEEIVFPSSLEQIIGNYVLAGSKKLKLIDLSNTSVEELGDWFFAGANDVEETILKLPKTLKTIGTYFLSSNTSVKNVDLCDTNISTFKGAAFEKSNVERIVLPSTMNAVSCISSECNAKYIDASRVALTSFMGSSLRDLVKCEVLKLPHVFNSFFNSVNNIPYLKDMYFYTEREPSRIQSSDYGLSNLGASQTEKRIHVPIGCSDNYSRWANMGWTIIEDSEYVEECE